jgi:4-azaleucine resistance transporter AzlC
MRLSRTTISLRAGARATAPIIVGVIPFGLVCGAAVVEAGGGVAEALGMALLVNAGASQLAATTLFGENAPLWVALITALVVNARLLIYSTSLAPVIMPEAGGSRWLLGHPLIDQSYAAVMTDGRYRDDIAIVPYYVGAWAMLASVWQVTNVIGAIGGTFVPTSWQLDFVIPLVFLGMLVPALRHRCDVEASLVSGVAAAILVPLLPLQTGLLVAIVLGMLWGAFRHQATGWEPPAEEQST